VVKFSLVESLFKLRHSLRYGLPELAATGRNRRAERQIAKWLHQLRLDPPDVLLGANIDLAGGVRQHLLGIELHSTYKVSLAPPDTLREKISYHDFHTTFRDQFFEYCPAGIKSVHSHVYPYFIEWCAEKRNSDTVWIHTYHAPYLTIDREAPLEPWEAEINRVTVDLGRRADVRISVSQWQRDHLLKEHGISSLYIPNGIDATFCDRADVHRFRSRYGSKPFVLFVGRNEEIKDPALFARIAAHMPQRDFVMIGDGLTATITESAWDMELPPNLRLLGRLTRIDVQDAIKACDALVVTSKREGFPTVVLEASLHSRPIVIPRDPGCMEAAGGEGNVFVFDRGNIDDAVEKTRQALSASFDAQRVRRRILAEFDWRVVAPQLDRLYARSLS
jgi:glycosyltransferase involved in cell wall biosynthesis